VQYVWSIDFCEGSQTGCAVIVVPLFAPAGIAPEVQGKTRQMPGVGEPPPIGWTVIVLIADCHADALSYLQSELPRDSLR
jgi:hypothetical protein